MPDALQVTPGDLDLVTRTLYGECRGEPLAGQQAVAWVIRNRASDPGWWTSYQSPTSTGRITAVGRACVTKGQFSCWLASDLNLMKLQSLNPLDPEYKALFEVGRSVMAGEIDDPTSGSTHYEVLGTGAAWAKDRQPEVIIGKHAFYRIGKNG